MITLYIGKSASGKDSIVRNILTINPSGAFNPIISYTNRPIRKGEKDGVDYHFVSKDIIEQMMTDNRFVEHRTYHTINDGKPDTWCYGTPNLDLSKNWIGIVDVGGATTLINVYGGNNFNINYVETADDIRKSRAMLRGSFDEAEWDRRAADDNVKFSDERINALQDLLNISSTHINDICVINNSSDKPVFSTWTQHLENKKTDEEEMEI